MKLKGILCITGLAITSVVSAQSLDRSVVANAGNVVTNSSLTLEFTIGETAVGSFTNSNNQLTTGFNQGYEEDNSSIAPILENSAVMVYPNPANMVLNINSELNGQVKIVSSIGSVVIENNPIHANVVAQLDIAALATGVYFVEVTDGNAVTRAKWIKN